MKTRGRILIIAAACGASLLATETHAAVYTVGTGPGCTHRSLAAAVTAAANNDFPVPQLDVIRLTRSVSGAVTWVTLTGLLTVVGGYETCSAPEPSGQTTLSGLGGTRGILQILGPGRTRQRTEITLHNLDLVSGRAEIGGAILIDGGGRVNIVNVSVHGNRATRKGGGIAVQGSAANGTAVMLERTLVYDNEAPGIPGEDGIVYYGAGGGVFCDAGGAPVENTTVHLGPGTAVSSNRAVVGGGIYVHVCTLTTRISGPGAGVFLNQADHGGGIGAYRSNLQFSSSAGGGLWVAMNTATTSGGGLTLSETRLDARDLMLTGNRAGRHGGGLFALKDVDIRIYGTNGCTAVRCPLIERNVDGAFEGHAIMFYWQRNEDPRSRLTLTNVHFRNNGDGGGAIVLARKVDLQAGGVVSQGNRARTLFDLREASRGLVEFLTSDDQAIGSVFDTGEDGTLTLRASIVAGDGGYRPQVFSSPGRAAVQCLLTHEIRSLPADARFVFAGYPEFVDRAAGDLRLRPFSPAIDFCDATGFVYAGERDAEGRARGVDAPAGDRFGRFDLGAYEYQP